LVRLGLGGIDVERPAVAADRLVQPPLHVQARAEVVVRFCMPRIEPHGLAVARLAFRVAAGGFPHPAERVVRGGGVRRGRDRAPCPLHALVEALGVGGDRRHEAQRAQVLGRAAQHRQAIDARFLQGAAPVRFFSPLKLIARAGHRET
jgi:hypothetical protein